MTNSILEVLEEELKGRWNKAEKLVEAGRELMAAGHPQSSEIAAYIDSLQKHWKELRQLAEQRKNRLEEAAEAYQVRDHCLELEHSTFLFIYCHSNIFVFLVLC